MVRKTWAPRGRTPILKVPGGWITRSVISAITCAPDGRRPRLCFTMVRGTVNAERFTAFLKQIKRYRHGRKLILIIDNLKAHKARVVMDYVWTQRAWLSIEYLPPYAPELNPPEYLWSSRKRRDFSNVRILNGASLDQHIRASGRRAQRDAPLLTGCLRASSLFPFDS